MKDLHTSGGRSRSARRRASEAGSGPGRHAALAAIRCRCGRRLWPKRSRASGGSRTVPALRFNPWLTLADTIGELLRHQSDAPRVPVRELDDLPTRTEARRLVRARNHWDEIKDEPIMVRDLGGYRQLQDGNHRLTVARERGEPLRVIFETEPVCRTV